jgi:hypothetical protein
MLVGGVYFWMIRPKRKISAKAVAKDIIAGADDFALMTKYRLDCKEFDKLLQKLVCARVTCPRIMYHLLS